MPTRREFLGVSTGAVAALAVPARPVPPAEAQAGCGTLPPSIKALTSQKDRAHPITVEERRARLDQARRLLAAEKLDALMLTGGTSLAYFTGIHWGLSERLLALILPKSGRAFIVCPAFEHDRAMEQIAAGPLKGDADVMTWEEHESPHRLIADGLRARGITAGRLGGEETVRWVFSSGAHAAMPAVELASGTPVTAGCRMEKSAHEVELMRLAALVTWTAYEAAWKALADGMTQDDFARLVSAAHEKLGFEGGAGVQGGVYSAPPRLRHAEGHPARLHPPHRRRRDGRRLPERHQPHLCPRQGHRPDEAGVRDRATGPEGGARRGAARRRVPGGGRRGAEGDCRCRVRTRLQVLHPPGGPRNGHGRPRVALPGPGQHPPAPGQHDHQRRARHLYTR